MRHGAIFPKSAIYILVNLKVWGFYAERYKGIFLRSVGKSKEERKACMEWLSSWKISCAGGKCCASVEQRQFQVINVLLLPALGKSGTLVGDLYNFMSKLRAAVERS